VDSHRLTVTYLLVNEAEPDTMQVAVFVEIDLKLHSRENFKSLNK
jgi:hypothetical protein